MTVTLDALLEQSEVSAADIEALISANDCPLVRPTGVTFLFRGEAEAVNLRHWIFGLPTSQALTQVAESDLWYLHLELPENSRIEYKFEVICQGQSEWVLDPLNPLTATDPFGANSVACGHGYERPEWTLPDPEARRGSLEQASIPSTVFGGERAVGLYLPARYRKTRRFPLLIVHDGDDFLRYAELATVLDNLIHRLEIPPMVVALTQSPRRLKEYAGDPAHARFLAEELIPWLEQRLPLDERPAARGLMGASFGAVASLHAAWSYPGVYGRLLLQSGSFAFTDIGGHKRGREFDPVVQFVNAFRKNPGNPARRLFLSCGIYESLIYENRSLLPLLNEQRIKVRYTEVRDGHNWENWRDRLQDGLSWLFPGPLWMVYE